MSDPSKLAPDVTASRTRQPPQPEDIQKRAMRSVLEYNRQLNQERKDDRPVCMDLQTYTVHHPVGLGVDNKNLKNSIKKRKKASPFLDGKRRYPVALMPSQYQDWYLKYSPQELKFLPLNTVIYGPNADVNPETGDLSGSDIGSEVLSDLDYDSSCSCEDEACNSNFKNSNSLAEQVFSPEKVSKFEENSSSSFVNAGPINACSLPSVESNNSATLASLLEGSKEQVQRCKVCSRDIFPGVNTIQCSDCRGVTHAACIDVHGELLQAIQLYPWQCQECKSCQQCGHPHDEEKIMFCDKCDRGYHSYCVGLETIPDGHWVCSLCAICASCGVRQPSVSGSSKQWQHELIKMHSPDGMTLTRHQVYCQACYQIRKK